MRWVPFFVLILAGLITASPLAAMTFSTAALGTDKDCARGKCTLVVVGEGEIKDDTADKLLAFLLEAEDKRVRRVLVMSSEGGSVYGSLKLGSMLREADVTVIVGQVASIDRETGIVAGYCVSACVYALMGGSTRVVPPGSRIGVHRMALPGHEDQSPLGFLMSERRAPKEFVDFLKTFAKDMGVDPALIAMAEKVAPSTLRELSQREIIRLRLGRPNL